jgi:hypothetical protein
MSASVKFHESLSAWDEAKLLATLGFAGLLMVILSLVVGTVPLS